MMVDERGGLIGSEPAGLGRIHWIHWIEFKKISFS